MGRVFTETVCVKCGVKGTEEGAQSDCPPVAWSHVTMCERLKGMGWTKHKWIIQGMLCPSCTKHIAKVVNSKRRE